MPPERHTAARSAATRKSRNQSRPRSNLQNVGASSVEHPIWERPAAENRSPIPNDPERPRPVAPHGEPGQPANHRRSCPPQPTALRPRTHERTIGERAAAGGGTRLPTPIRHRICRALRQSGSAEENQRALSAAAGWLRQHWVPVAFRQWTQSTNRRDHRPPASERTPASHLMIKCSSRCKITCRHGRQGVLSAQDRALDHGGGVEGRRRGTNRYETAVASTAPAKPSTASPAPQSPQISPANAMLRPSIAPAARLIARRADVARTAAPCRERKPGSRMPPRPADPSP